MTCGESTGSSDHELRPAAAQDGGRAACAARDHRSARAGGDGAGPARGVRAGVAAAQGVRRLRPADRLGADHLAAVHRCLHVPGARLRAATRCSKSAPARATARPCCRCWCRQCIRSSGSSRSIKRPPSGWPGSATTTSASTSTTARSACVREAPFDAILCTAGAEYLPTAYQDQLADGGRLVIPIGPHGHQQMYRFTRRGDEWYGDASAASASCRW